MSNSLSAAPKSPPVGSRPYPRRRFLWSRQMQQDTRSYYYQPAGLCEDYPREARTQARLDLDFRVLRQTGSKMLRVGISWLDIEPQPGRYEWIFWDSLVAMAARRHITLIPYVCYTPKWAASNQEDFWKQPPADVTQFGDFMQVIAHRYQGKVHAWELWNEPDNKDFWLGSAAAYAQMVRAGARGVRQADPNCVIVLGGLARGASPFLDALIDRYHIEDVVDVVNIHGYFETWDSHPLEDYPSYIDAVAKKIARSHSPLDLWMAELGYSSLHSDTGGKLSGNAPVYDYAYEHTAHYQAVALFKSHILALATGRLSLTAWYRINDLLPTTSVIGNEHNRFLGIMDSQKQPKPAFSALRLYNRLFNQPTRCLDGSLQVTPSSGNRRVLHLFQTKHGEIIIVGWLGDPSVRSEEVSATLPKGAGTHLEIYDLSGWRSDTSATLTANALQHIVLTGSELFIATISQQKT